MYGTIQSDVLPIFLAATVIGFIPGLGIVEKREQKGFDIYALGCSVLAYNS